MLTCSTCLVGRLYQNSLLATLNARKFIREDNEKNGVVHLRKLLKPSVQNVERVLAVELLAGTEQPDAAARRKVKQPQATNDISWEVKQRYRRHVVVQVGVREGGT